MRRFYLLAMDVASWVTGVSGALYLWAMERANDRTEHGAGADLGDEEPW